jgi:hypothetical protein
MKKTVCMAAGILLLAAGSSQAELNTVAVPLQAGKVTIDTNNADKDFAVIRMREMTGLGAAVADGALLRVKLRTIPGDVGYIYSTTIATADIVDGNKLQYEDPDIKMDCNLINELCNIYVKRTDINEDNLPGPEFSVLPASGETSEDLRVVVRIADTRYVYSNKWLKTVTPNLIRYTTPY